MLSGKWQPFCPGLNGLNLHIFNTPNNIYITFFCCVQNIGHISWDILHHQWQISLPPLTLDLSSRPNKQYPKKIILEFWWFFSFFVCVFFSIKYPSRKTKMQVFKLFVPCVVKLCYGLPETMNGWMGEMSSWHRCMGSSEARSHNLAVGSPTHYHWTRGAPQIPKLVSTISPPSFSTVYLI